MKIYLIGSGIILYFLIAFMFWYLFYLGMLISKTTTWIDYTKVGLLSIFWPLTFIYMLVTR